MFKLCLGLCLIAFVCGQGHHTTTPSPCQTRDDCAWLSCAGMAGQDHECKDGTCVCLDSTVGKRAGEPCKSDADCNGTTCNHGAPHCEVHDPSAEHGHCNCHSAVVRAGEPCVTDDDCVTNNCQHGAPHCEIHDPSAEHGHCNCHARSVRAGEPCVTDDDCVTNNCQHGAPHCEIHDPSAEHGHCNCHARFF